MYYDFNYKNKYIKTRRNKRPLWTFFVSHPTSQTFEDLTEKTDGLGENISHPLWLIVSKVTEYLKSHLLCRYNKILLIINTKLQK